MAVAGAPNAHWRFVQSVQWHSERPLSQLGKSTGLYYAEGPRRFFDTVAHKHARSCNMPNKLAVRK